MPSPEDLREHGHKNIRDYADSLQLGSKRAIVRRPSNDFFSGPKTRSLATKVGIFLELFVYLLDKKEKTGGDMRALASALRLSQDID